MLAACVLCLYGLLNGADLASTEWGLAQGAQEANPFARGRFNRVLLKVGSTGALAFMDSQLGPKPRKYLRSGAIALFAGVVANNVIQGIRARNGRLQPNQSRYSSYSAN